MADFKTAMTATYAQIARAATSAVKEAADIAKEKARANIASAGFSARWQNALQAKVYPTSGDSIDAAALIYHKIPYAGIFEHGGTIADKTWLPIEANLPGGGKRMRPQDFPGPLRLGRLGGKSVLFGQVAVGASGGVLSRPPKPGSRRASQVKKKWLVVFVSVSTIHDPKKFDIIATVKAAADLLPELYYRNLKT